METSGNSKNSSGTLIQKGIEEKVKELLSRMTLDEKVGQMTQVEHRYLTYKDDIKNYYLGSLLNSGGSAPVKNDPETWADMYYRYQSIALKTRLKIPLLYGVDAVHGHGNLKGATIFPHNIGLGCTRNPGLVEEAARITSKEVRGTGLNWTFAPCMAVPRNIRWGRTYEGFDETPELVKIMGEAAIKGYQGKDLADGTSVLACAKHYLGDGATTEGIDRGDTGVDEKELRSIHLPGYIQSIKAGVGSIMISYSSWKGERCHANKYLITDVLKNELGFNGIVVSDWKGIDDLVGNYKDKVLAAVNAGIDIVMVSEIYESFYFRLKSLVEEGEIPVSRIDDAVTRILRIKYLMGLFDNPFTDSKLTQKIGSEEHRKVARQCVRESLVLLKNDNNLLPLSKDLKHIHIAGRKADDIGSQCGGWTIAWQGKCGDITHGTTILKAIQQTVSPATKVSFSSNGADAVNAEIGIAVIGEDPYAEFIGDRDNLELTGEDISIIDNLKKAGIPVVVIILSGRPLIIESELPKMDAVIAAWLPGTEGQGIADILFGDYKPNGKLSCSWPKTMDQVNMKVGNDIYNPLFEYGYGLTY